MAPWSLRTCSIACSITSPDRLSASISRATRGSFMGSVHQLPREALAGAQGFELGLAERQGLWQRPRLAAQRHRPGVGRPAVEGRTVNAGEGFQTVEGI